MTTAIGRRRVRITDPELLLEILPFLAEGLNNAEIGRRLGIVEDSVKSRCVALFDYLGARNRQHAVALAYERDILPVGTLPEPVEAPTVYRVEPHGTLIGFVIVNNRGERQLKRYQSEMVAQRRVDMLNKQAAAAALAAQEVPA